MDQGGAAEGDFDFFVMPDIDPMYTGAITGGGDLFGMFNDTPQARALIQWLVTPQAQEIWAKIGGGYLAANKFVVRRSTPTTPRASLQRRSSTPRRSATTQATSCRRQWGGVLQRDGRVRPEPGQPGLDPHKP